jgi:hypothetical protein
MKLRISHHVHIIFPGWINISRVFLIKFGVQRMAFIPPAPSTPMAFSAGDGTRWRKWQRTGLKGALQGGTGGLSINIMALSMKTCGFNVI